METQFSPEPSCTLNLDILELILYEHRNDHPTLAASALASQSLLQIARKFLYRSVSLDYCENPYGHDQQRRLRASLSMNTHLCTYIRTLRLSLPGKKSRDRVLDAILRGLKRVESLHVIGAGMDAADAVTDERYLVPLLDQYHHHYSSTAILNGGGVATPSNAVARREVELAGNGSVEEALKKVFALKSLRKVTLENIYPLDEMFVGCFTELKHLELISVGGGPTKVGLSSIDASTSAIPTPGAVDAASGSISSLPIGTPSLTGLGLPSSLASSGTSPAPFTSSRPTIATPRPQVTPASNSAPSAPSPPSSTSPPNPPGPFPASSSAPASLYLGLSDHDTALPHGQVPQDRRGTGPETLVTMTQASPVFIRATTASSDPDSHSVSSHWAMTYDAGSQVTRPVLAGLEEGGHGGGTSSGSGRQVHDETADVGSGVSLGHGMLPLEMQMWSERGWEERRGKSVQRRKVQLEYLVLNLEHLKPVLDVIYGHIHKECLRCNTDKCASRRAVDARLGGSGGSEEEGGRWDERCAVEDGECSSTLDLSGLKQAHVYVWDSDDGHGIWSILHTARRSLERLTLRYFQYTEEHFVYHLGFDNLQSLVLGTHTFSICEDPFRPLILFMNDPAKFSCLRKVKISFDLWGCESSGSSWKEVSGYRGWVELDECFAALDVGCSKGSTIITTPNAQLESIVFELWCSAGYKAISSCPSRLVKSSREANLLTMIREELPYLKRNRNFMLL